MSPLPSFLSKTEHVSLPTGGDFQPSGFIGPFTASILHSFYSDVDLVAEYKAMDKKLALVSRRKMGQGWRYYFKDAAVAKEALEASGNDKIKNANQMWVFQAETEHILNLAAENREKFGDLLTYDVGLMTLRSKKRHEFHLLALPCAVAAMARLLGYDTPGYSVAELTTQDAVFSDAFQASMIGDPDGDYTESVLWQRRAALWAALGEDDPRKYTVGAGNAKTDTAAEKLSECLSIVNSVWTGPAYIRLVQVPDPRVDAVYGDERKRLSVACIFDIYPDAKTAKAVADAELAEREARKGASGATANGYVLPTDWQGMEADFVQELKAQKGKSAPAAAKALSVTVEEVKAAREHYQIG